MQKNNRKCYQFSHALRAQSMPRPGSLDGRDMMAWGAGVVRTHEASHGNKGEDYSPYLPHFAWRLRPFRSRQVGLPTNFKPRISNLYSNLPTVAFEVSSA